MRSGRLSRDLADASRSLKRLRAINDPTAIAEQFSGYATLAGVTARMISLKESPSASSRSANTAPVGSSTLAGTLELSEALTEGRERFPDNGHFSHWLIDQDLDALGADDRAALIGMGKNLELTRAVLQETQSRSWQLIWRNEMQPRLRNVTKTEVNEAPAPIAEKEPGKSEIQPEPISEDAETDKEPSPPTAKVTKASKFFGMPRAEEVAAIYTNQSGRAYVGKLVSGRGGKDCALRPPRRKGSSALPENRCRPHGSRVSRLP